MIFDFQNKKGETLSGRLEIPKDIEVKAYAIFAHCFTCSKNFTASSTLAKNLSAFGIGVLRFDFTGLGASEGDFSNSNFTSNVEDLISAFESMKASGKTPKLLVGHSLGGAAVLKAAPKLEEIKAVATIAAPSCVEHVAHLFEDEVDEIKEEGSAEISLFGRSFNIKQQFVDDITTSEILKDVHDFKKSLLVMHSPTDNTVSIDHAAQIFTSAKHPKSFVSLDSADHLLLDRKDSQYAAKVIGSWTQRYL